MKLLKIILTLLFTSIFITACGGSGDDTPAVTVAQYAGHYTGTVAGDPGHEKNAGPLEITIAQDGSIKGTCTVNGYPQVLAGSVNIDGVVTMEMRYAPDTNYHSMNMNGKISGTSITGTSREIYTPEVTGTWQAKKD